MFSHKTDPDQRSDDDRAYTDEGANDETENTETANAEDVNADGTEARAPFGEPVDGADDDVTDASAESADRDVTAGDTTDSDTLDGDVVEGTTDDDHRDGFTTGDNDAADADAEAGADLDADADATDARDDDVIDGVVVDEHSSTAPLDDEEDDEQMSAEDAAVVTAGDHTGDDDLLAGERDGEFAGDQPSHVDMSRVDQEALLEDEDDDADVDDVDDIADVDDETDLTDDDADATAASDLGADATGYAGDAVPVVVVDEPADQDAYATSDDAELVTTGADASLSSGGNGVLRPGDAPIPGGDVEVVDADAIHERWQQVQLGFIDDPRGSATGARDIAANALENHITALRARLTALDVWQQETKPDTEVLRAAMQGYRAMVEALIGQAP